MNIIKNCIICGDVFEARPYESKFIKCCSNKCGIKLRQNNFDKKIENRIGKSIKDWLIEHYINQNQVYSEICEELQINTRTLMRYMKQFKIPIRNPSNAVKLQWVRNPERHKEGLKIALNGVSKRATFLRNNPQIAETNLMKELNAREIRYEFQYPVYSFILDFAFPDFKIDIELDNPKRCGVNLDRLEKTKNRIKKLNSLGWKVIQFSTKEDSYLIANKIEVILQQATTNIYTEHELELSHELL